MIFLMGIVFQLTTFCQNCTDNQICLKFAEPDKPTCVEPLDRKDPTGCGGHCALNTQYCHLLDNQHKVYQCRNNKNTLKCPEESFNCGNMCISMVKKCDGIIHCSDKSDEKNCDCNLNTHFHCGNKTSCISKEKRCDGAIDCWDRSDEADCNKRCLWGYIPCRNGQCVARDTFCDGKADCSDYSDEPEGCQI